MARQRNRRRYALPALALALLLPACGKKAPLRLPEDRPAEQAPALRARVREAAVMLEFRVPNPRFFPERQQRWVLARILRRAAPSAELVEAGAILEAGGFAYGAPLVWIDQGRQPKISLVYQVEFRDADRKRRALTLPVTVAWDRVPRVPSALTAGGGATTVSLTWETPGEDDAQVRHRVYRRELPQPDPLPVTPEPVDGSRFVDSRAEPGREYCYSVRGVLDLQGLEVEGPASPEACARTVSEELPPQQPPAANAP